MERKTYLFIAVGIALALVVLVYSMQPHEFHLGQKILVGTVSISGNSANVYLISYNVTCAMQEGSSYINKLPNGSVFTPIVPEGDELPIAYSYESHPTGTFYNYSGDKLSCFRVFSMGQYAYFLFPFSYNGTLLKVN